MNDSVDRAYANFPEAPVSQGLDARGRLIDWMWASRPLRALVLGVIVFLTLVIGPAGWQPPDAALAQSAPNRAGVVVQFPGGKVEQACVGFDQPQILGTDLLIRSQMPLVTAQSPMGVAVCKIDGMGCDASNCLTCQGNSYWSYWRLKNGAWTYSQVGAYAARVDPGGVDGWVWGQGSQPPARTFEQICSAAAPSSSPIPASATAVATSTTQPTATAAHSATPITPSATAQPTQTRAPSTPTWTWTAVPPTQTAVRSSTPIPPTSTPVPPVSSANPPIATAAARNGQAAVISLPTNTPPNTVSANGNPVPANSPVAGAAIPSPTLASTANASAVVVTQSTNQGTMTDRMPERNVNPPMVVPSPRPASPSPAASQAGAVSSAPLQTRPANTGAQPSGALVNASQSLPLAREVELASDAPVPTTRPRAAMPPDIGQQAQPAIRSSTALSGQDEPTSLLIRTPRPFNVAVMDSGSVALANGPLVSGRRQIGSAAPIEAPLSLARAGPSAPVVSPTRTIDRISTSIAPPFSFTWGHLTFGAMSLGLFGFLAISMRTR